MTNEFFKTEIRRTVKSVVREDPRAKAAFAARRARGLSNRAAEDEIGRALLGCLWEASRGLPDRFTTVLKGLEQGQSTESLFPDALYSKGDVPPAA